MTTFDLLDLFTIACWSRTYCQNDLWILIVMFLLHIQNRTLLWSKCRCMHIQLAYVSLIMRTSDVHTYVYLHGMVTCWTTSYCKLLNICQLSGGAPARICINDHDLSIPTYLSNTQASWYPVTPYSSRNTCFINENHIWQYNLLILKFDNFIWKWTIHKCHSPWCWLMSGVSTHKHIRSLPQDGASPGDGATVLVLVDIRGGHKPDPSHKMELLQVMVPLSWCWLPISWCSDGASPGDGATVLVLVDVCSGHTPGPSHKMELLQVTVPLSWCRLTSGVGTHQAPPTRWSFSRWQDSGHQLITLSLGKLNWWYFLSSLCLLFDTWAHEWHSSSTGLCRISCTNVWL